MKLFVHADRPACQRLQRILEPVANITVGAERQVHGPHEYGAVLLFKRCVEIGVVPQPRADPHEAPPFPRIRGDACVHARLHFISKILRVLNRPFAAAEPLRRHHVGDLLVHAHGSFRRIADQLADFLEILLLPVHAFHQRAQGRSVESAACDAFERADQNAKLCDG